MKYIHHRGDLLEKQLLDEADDSRKLMLRLMKQNAIKNKKSSKYKINGHDLRNLHGIIEQYDDKIGEFVSELDDTFYEMENPKFDMYITPVCTFIIIPCLIILHLDITFQRIGCSPQSQ